MRHLSTLPFYYFSFLFLIIFIFLLSNLFVFFLISFPFSSTYLSSFILLSRSLSPLSSKPHRPLSIPVPAHRRPSSSSSPDVGGPLFSDPGRQQ
jgi:hypothetical protein